MKETITQKVKFFYEELPFNKSDDFDSRLRRIKNNPIVQTYPDLDKLLLTPKLQSVLEVGCGTGWLSNTIAANYRKQVLAIDMTAAALAEAKKLTELAGTSANVQYVETDLFEFHTDQQFDLLVSLGVLHHTYDTEAAFYAIEKSVKKGGYVYIGLYHKYGREVFLNMFTEMIDTKGEEYAFDFFKQMKGVSQKDTIFQQSWYRDQVLHVHEKQHTFEEVADWLTGTGYKIISTSINRFGQIKSLTELASMEKDFAGISYKRNYEENSYFPGFFTVLAQKL